MHPISIQEREREYCTAVRPNRPHSIMHPISIQEMERILHGREA
jgi:hypothetical protein